MKTSVYFYLNDRSRPNPDTMAKLCEVLGIPYAEGVALYCTPRNAGRQFKT